EWKLESPDSWINLPVPEGQLLRRSSTQVPIEISAVGLRTGTYTGRLLLTAGTMRQTIYVVAHITPEAARLTVVGGNTIRGRAGSAVSISVLVTDADENPISDAA